MVDSVSESPFEKFWGAWPSPKDPKYRSYKRKTDKRKCCELWEKRGYDKIAATIMRDVEQRAKYDKGWLQQEGEFLSAPLVYLRNERWDGSEWSDIRDEKKPKVKRSAPQQFDEGPDCSRWARYANLYLLKQLLTLGGVGDEERLRRIVAAKNSIVRQAENDGDWEPEDFKSVLHSTIQQTMELRANANS